MRRAFSLLLACAACAAPPDPDGSLRWSRGSSLHTQHGYGDRYYVGSDQVRRGTGYGGIEFFTGYRSLPRSTFGEARTQGLAGAQVLVPLDEGPLSVELAGSFSRDKAEAGGIVTLDGRVAEVSLGLRLAAGGRHSNLVPYVAGGVTTLYARLRDGILEETRDDLSAGFYARVGLIVYVSGNEYLALEWRGVDGTELSLCGDDDGADYNQVSIVFGYSW